MFAGPGNDVKAPPVVGIGRAIFLVFLFVAFNSFMDLCHQFSIYTLYGSSPANATREYYVATFDQGIRLDNKLSCEQLKEILRQKKTLSYQCRLGPYAPYNFAAPSNNLKYNFWKFFQDDDR